jgi:hypothetical protein
MISHHTPAWVISIMRHPVSYISNITYKVTQLRYARGTHRGDDEVELTRNSDKHGVGSRHNQRLGDEEDGLAAELSHSSAANKALKSGRLGDTVQPWPVSQGQIIDTTEVKMERLHTSGSPGVKWS